VNEICYPPQKPNQKKLSIDEKKGTDRRRNGGTRKKNNFVTSAAFSGAWKEGGGEVGPRIVESSDLEGKQGRKNRKGKPSLELYTNKKTQPHQIRGGKKEVTGWEFQASGWLMERIT